MLATRMEFVKGWLLSLLDSSSGSDYVCLVIKEVPVRQRITGWSCSLLVAALASSSLALAARPVVTTPIALGMNTASWDGEYTGGNRRPKPHVRTHQSLSPWISLHNGRETSDAGRPARGSRAAAGLENGQTLNVDFSLRRTGAPLMRT